MKLPLLFAAILLLAAFPDQAIADEVTAQQASLAVQILKLAFRCPEKIQVFRPQRGPTQRQFNVHEYQGDSRTFRVVTVSTKVTTLSGSEPHRNVETEIIVARFADLGRVVEGDPQSGGINFHCDASKECIHEMDSSSERPPRNYEDIEHLISVCDQKTAENIKVAMDVLIKFNR